MTDGIVGLIYWSRHLKSRFVIVSNKLRHWQDTGKAVSWRGFEAAVTSSLLEACRWFLCRLKAGRSTAWRAVSTHCLHLPFVLWVVAPAEQTGLVRICRQRAEMAKHRPRRNRQTNMHAHLTHYSDNQKRWQLTMHCQLRPPDLMPLSFWGFESELQTNQMPFQLDSLWGATLMPLRACAMDWGRNRILRVGKNFGPILSRLWSKVKKFWDCLLGPLVLSNALAQLSMSCFFKKTFAVKSRNSRKTECLKVFSPQFLGRTTPTFIRQIVSAIYCPPFGKVWLSYVC